MHVQEGSPRAGMTRGKLMEKVGFEGRVARAQAKIWTVSNVEKAGEQRLRVTICYLLWIWRNEQAWREGWCRLVIADKFRRSYGPIWWKLASQNNMLAINMILTWIRNPCNWSQG